MNIFIVKLFTKGTYEYVQGAQEYCFSHKPPLVAIGWGVEENDIINIKDVEDFVYKKHKDSKGFITAYNHISKNMKKGDFVWTQYNNGRNFMLGKITDDKCFIDKRNPLIGFARHCEWRPIDYNDVPGEIINSYQRRTITLFKKHNLKNFEEYFNYLYYGSENYVLTKKQDYKQLLHYDDLEDLLGIYLNKAIDEKTGEKYEYYIIPSTNKISTKLIEYELRRETNGIIEKACVQCKTGNSSVPEDFFKLEEFKDYHIFISTMKNENYDSKGTNVTTILTDTLWNWAKKNKTLLPGRIQKYIDICE